MMRRFIDISLAIALFPILFIFLFIFSMMILVLDRHYPLYLQIRVGKYNKPFTCIKFKAMRGAERENDVNDKEKDQIRTTPIGSWIRNRGIDELPQILNIFFGKMSFVGPRPLLEKNIKKIEVLNPDLSEPVSLWEKERSKVLPGLSGWHQIHSLGQGILKYDLDYLENPSVDKHIKIFLATLIVFLIGKERYFKRYPTGLF